MKAIIATLAAFMLASCATTSDKAETASALSVDPDAVLSQYKCYHGVGPRNARATAWEQHSMCIRTQDRMVFGRYDTKSRSYVHSSSVPFHNVKEVRLYQRGLATQVQLDTDAGVHVFGVKTMGIADADRGKTEAEYSALAQAGIPAAQATAYVGKSNREMFVPFFLPSR